MKNKRYAVRAVELNQTDAGLMRILDDTCEVYRAAVKRISRIAIACWEEFDGLTAKGSLTRMEQLIHTTKNNTALFPDFDTDFYKLPAYYRRSAIHAAIGAVSSFMTRHGQYLEKRRSRVSAGKRFQEKPPVLNLDAEGCPSMYDDQMYRLDGTKLRIKVRIRNTWDWMTVTVPERDAKSLARAVSEGGILKSPKLVRRYRKYYLQFPVGFPKGSFPDTEVPYRTMLGVDLGINRGAVCSVCDASGTISERHYDPFTAERDRMNHMLNRLRKASRMSGSGQPLSAFYTKLDGVKGNYTRQLARWIVDAARGAGVYGIVMERLSGLKGKGRKRDRTHHWCKRRIIALVKGMALHCGIRVFEVNPRNTSALAYDGSGPVVRDEHNHSMCTFASGKRYDCDLSASYNIAARYFIREFRKSIPETGWSQCVAKVPALAKRTDCVLATLRALDAVMHPAENAA